MAALNYAQEYAKELAQAYPYVLYSGALWNTENSTKYRVVDAKTILVLEVEQVVIEILLEGLQETLIMLGKLKH